MDILNLIFTDYTLRIVSLGSILLGIISGVLGSFAVIRKESLLGDAISHAALPGIVLVFLFTGNKNTEMLLLGALISGLLATGLILLIERYSRVKFDSALALILSVFFGGGMVLLTYIQNIPDANQAGLDKFIFGQASTLLKRDVQLMFVVGLVLIGLLILFWKEIKLSSFDAEFAESLGFSNRNITILLFGMIVVSIIVGLQTVGVILMSAMLIAPGVAARQWTNDLKKMVVLAAFFGGISGFLGTIISSFISNLPTGPTIVIVISGIVFISLLFAPNRGLIWKYVKNARSQNEIDEDRLLTNLYHLAMNHEERDHSHEVGNIQPNKKEKYILRKLEALEERGYVEKDYFNKWNITAGGIEYIENYFRREEL